MASFTVNADMGSWFANTLGGAGNGKGDRMTVGMGVSSWNWQNRFALRFPRPTTEFAAIPNVDRITAVYAWVRANNDNAGIGGAPKFVLERATAAFSENSEARRAFVSTVGSNPQHWPGPATTTTDRGEYNGAAPAAGAWVKVDVTNLGKWLYSNPSETALSLHAKASNGTGTLDESNTARRLTIQSDDGTSKPYLEFIYSTNDPPNVPTDLSPLSGETQGSAAGTSLALSARHTDPEGDAATHDWFEVYPDSATDGTPGTYLKSVDTTATTAHNAIRSRTITGLPARTFVKWRAKFKDATAYGPWSNLQRILTAYLPGVPVSLFVTPGTLTPDIFASLVSSDPSDFITAGRVLVEQVPAVGSIITKWDSLKQTIGGASNRMQLPYGGSALVYGTQYRMTVWLWNRDDVMSPPTGYFQFTQREAVGPLITPGDAGTKIDTLTPTFTLTADGAEMDRYRFRWYSATGTLISDTGEVAVATTDSIPVVTPSGIWDWGQNPKVDAAVRITGNADMGPTAPQATLHINAKPGSPYPLSAYHGSAQVVLRTDGTYVVDTAQPILVLPFRDTDRDLGYTDNPTRREIELRVTGSGAHVGASPYIITSGITDEWTVPAAILVAETTYKFRGNYDDSAAVRSDWSEYVFLKRSAAPTLSSVTPANAATITDPTTPFAWTYASSGSKAQAFWRLQVYVAGDPIYDSGVVAGTAAGTSLPPLGDLMPTATVVTWTLDVWDSDGLKATQISRTFTTNFSAPAALTGLAVIADEDAKALLVSWTVSSLTDAEHEATYVYARTGDGAFELVATILERTTTSYLYRAAPHNREVIIRVTQSNGYAESEPAEETATLGGDEEPDILHGYWWLRPEPLELRYVRVGAFSAEPITIDEEHEPKGATDLVVLTWSSYGHRWQVRLFLPPQDRSVLDTLTADYRSGRVGILKTPDGDVFYSKIRSVPKTHLEVGYNDVPITGTEVDGSAVGF